MWSVLTYRDWLILLVSFRCLRLNPPPPLNVFPFALSGGNSCRKIGSRVNFPRKIITKYVEFPLRKPHSEIDFPWLGNYSLVISYRMWFSLIKLFSKQNVIQLEFLDCLCSFDYRIHHMRSCFLWLRFNRAWNSYVNRFLPWVGWIKQHNVAG